MTKLTDNFTLREMTRSRTAAKRGIQNIPNGEQIRRLRDLCEFALEPTRAIVGHPLHVTSGFRSQALNKAIRGAKTSQHMRGEAADIECFHLSTYDLAVTIRENGVPFDQLILEAYTPAHPNSGWVHVSFTTERRNRFEVLTWTPRKWRMLTGGRAYRKGLHK
ncbi:MAG: D-Ala-D-Ala carboxypeptidase family metallohydrolase [Epibacterium sp.]|nr:D-Ala-D-Ala carboxypeptidase family metallohydrolase [Epibacterium sp.]NQX73737.1 DUF882 domain-containing protein [Epibacterium sp.]